MRYVLPTGRDTEAKLPIRDEVGSVLASTYQAFCGFFGGFFDL
jgi:hypothetical protein